MTWKKFTSIKWLYCCPGCNNGVEMQSQKFMWVGRDFFGIAEFGIVNNNIIGHMRSPWSSCQIPSSWSGRLRKSAGDVWVVCNHLSISFKHQRSCYPWLWMTASSPEKCDWDSIPTKLAKWKLETANKHFNMAASVCEKETWKSKVFKMLLMCRWHVGQNDLLQASYVPYPSYLIDCVGYANFVYYSFTDLAL